MSLLKRLAAGAVVAAIAAVGIMAMPKNAEAWWRYGVGVGVVLPPVVVAPAPVYAAPVYAPPVVVAPPPVVYAAPRRVWVPAHWQGPYWVPGHWG